MVRVRKVLSVPQVAVAMALGLASGLYIYRTPLQQYKHDTKAPPNSDSIRSEQGQGGGDACCCSDNKEGDLCKLKAETNSSTDCAQSKR